MSFEPQFFSPFTTVGTLASIAIVTMIGFFSFVAARRILRGPGSRRVLPTLIAGVLTLLTVLSSMVLLAWMANRHI